MQSREAEKGERMADGFVRVFLDPYPLCFYWQRGYFYTKREGNKHEQTNPGYKRCTNTIPMVHT